MDAQAKSLPSIWQAARSLTPNWKGAHYLFQRNPNDAGPNGPQRPGGGGNSNGSDGGPPSNPGISLLVRSLVIIGIVLLGWYLFSYFLNPGSSASTPNAIEVPYSTFYQQVQQGNVNNVLFQGQDVTGDFKTAVKVTDANGNTKSGTSFHFTQLTNGDPNL